MKSRRVDVPCPQCNKNDLTFHVIAGNGLIVEWYECRRCNVVWGIINRTDSKSANN